MTTIVSYLPLCLIAFATIVVCDDDAINSNSLPNSCIGLEDGDYWFQLSVDDSDYMPLQLTCSNQHMILDISRDEDLIEYFSSYEMWHYQVAGPKNADPVNWEEWFLPHSRDINSDSSYYISPDCQTCETSHERQVFSSQTSYWMTGSLAKLRWPVVGFNDCDMDYDSYICYDCTSCQLIGDGCDPTEFPDTTTDYKQSGICGVTVGISNRDVFDKRTTAQQIDSVNYKPSIGTDGEFCVCYQPSMFNMNELNRVQEEVLKQKKQEKEKSGLKNSQTTLKNAKNTITTQDKRDTNIVYLTQNDFEDGTYRILESGTYIISQDITFDFNKDVDYWPQSSQIDDYPGAASYRDAYHMGFFAGITIESDYVTIDLNNKELKQSIEFYYQQRWFAIIECGNQQFLPGQGPSYFGYNPLYISNIKIMNGVLGRSSHMGIHGNFPTNIEIINVHIKDFATHGLQFNGWNGLIMDNVEIGPSSTIEYLRGDFGHARVISQRLRWIEKDLITSGNINTQTIQFANHDTPQTVSDIADELELQMELALNYAMNRATGGLYSENDFINPNLLDIGDVDDDNRWTAAKRQFIHTSGFPSASSITGMFLNFEGASVFAYTMYTTRQSKNGVLNNIYIHDISHDMVESMRFYVADSLGQSITTPWNSDIPAEVAFGGKDQLYDFYKIQSESKDFESIRDTIDSKFAYNGGIMTDAYFSMPYFSDDWGYLGLLETKDYTGDSQFTAWVNGDDIAQSWKFGCNEDIMAHSGKGLLGLRIDGVDTINLDNIRIENLYEYGDLGSDVCGSYHGYTPETNGGHFHQSLPMQWGFSGNDLQAMSIISSTNVEIGNININNLKNDYSQAFGVSFWTANEVSMKENAIIKISNIEAGVKLEEGLLNYLSKPNRSPEACSIRLETVDTADYYESVINLNNNNIMSCNIVGHERCLGDDNNEFTLYGSYFESEETCQSVENYQDLSKLVNINSEKNGLVNNDRAGDSSNGIFGSLISDDSKNNDLYNFSTLFAVGFTTTFLTFLILLCTRFVCKKEMNNNGSDVNSQYGAI